jgi:lipoate-protein ligase A
MGEHFPFYDYDDELIAAAGYGRRAMFRVYRPPRCVVVLGRGSKPEQEVDLAICRADAVEVCRRRGGGCSVVLDPGNVVVSCAAPVEGIGDNSRYLRSLSDWLVAGLEQIGIRDLGFDGVSDLVQWKRKVSGSCLYRPRGLLYYSATLLVDADLALISRYLRHPPREPAYRGSRSHDAFVANLTLPARLGGAEAVASELAQTLRPPRVGADSTETDRR